jgi:hypothetical protein
MYRLATFLALLIVLPIGCGGGSDEDSNPPAPAAAKAPSTGGDAPKAKSTPAAKKTAGRKKAAESPDEPAEKAAKATDEHGHADEPKNLEEALANAPSAAIARLIKVTVTTVGMTYNLKIADVALSENGRNLTVVVTRASACNAVAKEEYAMGERVSMAIPSIKSVRWEVAGSGEQLGAYVLRCKRAPIPNGPGVTVFDRTAVGGPVTTKPFTIKGRRWAIEYENTSNTLAVIVIPLGGKAKGKYYAPIGSKKREVGRKMYRRPGKYMMKIHGAALWTVRVKDIR